MKNAFLFAAALAAAAVNPADAQTPAEQAVYTSVGATPIGSLAPIMTNTIIDRLQNGASLSLRYGNLSRGDFNVAANAFGVTAILPAGLGSSFSLTGGVITRDCTNCKSQLMLGAGGDMRLYGTAGGTTSTAPLFTVSLDGDLGYGHLEGANFFSGYVGVPLAMVQRGSGMQFVPFITPAFAFGKVSDNFASESGSGLMLGGGLGIYNRLTNVSVNAGVQHSFMNGARNTVGLNVTIGGK